MWLSYGGFPPATVCLRLVPEADVFARAFTSEGQTSANVPAALLHWLMRLTRCTLLPFPCPCLQVSFRLKYITGLKWLFVVRIKCTDKARRVSRVSERLRGGFSTADSDSIAAAPVVPFTSAYACVRVRVRVCVCVRVCTCLCVCVYVSVRVCLRSSAISRCCVEVLSDAFIRFWKAKRSISFIRCQHLGRLGSDGRCFAFLF